MSDKSRGSSRRWAWVGGISGAVVVLLVIATVFAGSDRAAQASAVPTFTVSPATLPISITESGSIRAREQLVIKSEVEGQTTILYLIPEGTRVRQGDLLVELDASKLQDDLIEQDIRQQNAEASFIRARENLEVVKNQAAADVAKAKLDARFAAEDVTTYMQGEYPQKLRELQSKISLSEEELKRAEQKVEGSRTLAEEKYIARTELQADELAANKARLDRDLAQANLDLFQRHTHPRRVDELNAALEQATMALERAERKAAADVVQAEADLRAKESEFRRQEAKVEKLRQQIARTRITAPRDGVAVYATSTQVNWRGNQEPLDEGQTVRERQELIHLPTAEAMSAAVKIQESALDTVALGMPVRLTVDALPGKLFTGRVVKIAPLPDATSMFMNPDLKVYDTVIDVDQTDPALRTGMSCTVEILAARYDNALFVPVQAVVRHGTQPVVYVRRATGFEPQPVQLGMDNNRVVHIVSGVSDGDLVSLRPPLSSASTDMLAMTAEPAAAPVAAEPAAPTPTLEVSAAPAVTEPARTDAPDPATATEPGARAGRQEMTPEQREQMRQRFQNMTPEERERMREARRQRDQQGGGAAGGERNQ